MGSPDGTFTSPPCLLLLPGSMSAAQQYHIRQALCCDACTETGQRCCSVQPMMWVMRPCSKQRGRRPTTSPPAQVSTRPMLGCPARWTEMHCLTDHCGHHAIKSRDVVVGLNRVRLLLRPSCLFHHPHHHHCAVFTQSVSLCVRSPTVHCPSFGWASIPPVAPRQSFTSQPARANVIRSCFTPSGKAEPPLSRCCARLSGAPTTCLPVPRDNRDTPTTLACCVPGQFSHIKSETRDRKDTPASWSVPGLARRSVPVWLRHHSIDLPLSNLSRVYLFHIPVTTSLPTGLIPAVGKR